MDDDECVPGRLRLGLCERHYRRAHRTGSTESSRIDNWSNYVEAPSGCWVWVGAVWANGYGKLSVKFHGTRLAHRAFYIQHVGTIPDGHDVDHRCHNADPDCVRGVECEHRRCVNPAHLEPVLHAVNLIRAVETRSMCEAGLHDLSLPGAVRLGTSQCVECWRARYRAAGQRYRDRKRAERAS